MSQMRIKMSEAQIALHEKFIKGINWRMLIYCASVLITIVFYGTKLIDKQENQGRAIIQISDDFKSMKQLLDTVRANQIKSNTSNYYEFKDIHRQLDSK